MENLNFTKIIEIKKRIDFEIGNISEMILNLRGILVKLNKSIRQDSTYMGIDNFNFQIIRKLRKNLKHHNEEMLCIYTG